MTARPSLTTDLHAARRYIERNVMCHVQKQDGWYVKDCIEMASERGVNDPPLNSCCERCGILLRLSRQLARAKPGM
jgi:hypothetical protein